MAATDVKPDWGHWANLATVSIPEAIWLSLGFDPVAMQNAHELEDFPLASKRLQAAKSHAANGALQTYANPGGWGDSHVKLHEFRAWGETLPEPFQFPYAFPGARIFGTKMWGGGNIMLGYDDFIRLFNVTDPENFAPHLEVRPDGVYVVPPKSDDNLMPEERAALTAHPTGNLRDPALPLPCRLADVEVFADFYGLRAAIDPFTMLTIANKLTWAHAQVERQTEQGFIHNFLPGLMALRRTLARQHDAESNDSKKVVQRTVLDELNRLLASIDNADGDWDSEAVPAPVASKWPWGDHETELLRKLAEAVGKFWKLYDPTDTTTAPKNKAIVDWLTEQGVAERNAQVMATILRADNLPTGPRK